MSPAVRRYLSQLGRKGGRVSRRVLSAEAARDMVKVREARRAFKAFRAQCFSSNDPAYVVTLTDVPWVAQQLMAYGGRAGWALGAKLMARRVVASRSMQRIPAAILEAGVRLFWDVDSKLLDPEKHEDFIFGRVLSEGDWTVVRALRAEVGDGALRAFVDRAPHRLDARTRRFLEVVLPPSEEKCTTTPFRRNSDALFRH